MFGFAGQRKKITEENNYAIGGKRWFKGNNEARFWE
jgi:hypothetical protein